MLHGQRCAFRSNANHRCASRLVALTFGFGTMVICFLAQAVAGQSCVTWSGVSIPSRKDHAMAYDSARHVLVVFGGEGMLNDNEYSAQTWEWDGQRWALRATTGPSARGYASMAYDSKRGVTVLFGGHSTSTYALGDTWEWDGTAWTLRAATGPSPRWGHSMTYDSSRGVVVLTGANLAGDSITWEWDGTAWTPHNVAAPSQRYVAAMAFDSSRGVSVLYGGQPDAGGPMLADTWEWNGESWTLRATTGAPPVRDHSMAYDPVRQRTVMFGGVTPPYSFQPGTWEWDGTQWTHAADVGPTFRISATMAYDDQRGGVLLVGGGYTNYAYADLWQWDGRTWNLIQDTPSLLGSHHLAYDSVHHLTLAVDHTSLYHATWGWDGVSWKWLSDAPVLPDGDDALAFDSIRGVLVMFLSGCNLNDVPQTWEWDGKQWTLRATGGPIPRCGESMAFDSDRGVCVLYGGGTGINETWEWDGDVWALRAAGNPQPRWRPGMAYDTAGHKTVLFGGAADSKIWEWDGAAWTSTPAFGPPTSGIALTYDSGRSRTLLVGETGGSQYTMQTWEWNGSMWILRSTGAPTPARTNPGLSYDPVRAMAVVLGGSYFGGLNDTWEFRVVLQIDQQPYSVSVYGGLPIQLSVQASGVGDLYYQWRKDGQPLVDGGNISGATTPLLSINAAAYVDVGHYTVAINNESCTLTSADAYVDVILGDANQDGHIGLPDLLAVINSWGPCAQMTCPADLTGDGVVNAADLNLVVNWWGY